MIDGLLSATFLEPDTEHLIEVVHEGGSLDALVCRSYDAAGRQLDERDHLGEAIIDTGRVAARTMYLLDTRYDPEAFPYRPHHYGWLTPLGGTPVYYGVNAVMGGAPERLGPAVSRGNHEGYIFPRGGRQQWSLYLGNCSRFATTHAHVVCESPDHESDDVVTLVPFQHIEYEIPASARGVRLKSPHRLASYIVGRDPATRHIVLLDHLMAFFK